MAGNTFFILFISFTILFSPSSSFRGEFNGRGINPITVEQLGDLNQKKLEQDLKSSASDFVGVPYNHPYDQGTYFRTFGGSAGFNGIDNYGGGQIPPIFQPGYRETNYRYSPNDRNSYANTEYSSTGYDTNDARGTINVGYNLPRRGNSYNQLVVLTPNENREEFASYGNNHVYEGFESGHSNYPPHGEPLYDNYRFEQQVYDRRTKCRDIGK